MDVECGSGVVDCLGLYAGDAYTDVQDVDARYRKALNTGVSALQEPVQKENSRIVGDKTFFFTMTSLVTKSVSNYGVCCSTQCPIRKLTWLPPNQN